MLNLIKNEIYKIFHKKSTFIVLFITILYAILVNVIYFKMNNDAFGYSYSDDYYGVSVPEMKTYVDNFNPNTDDVYLFSEYSAQLDVRAQKGKYESTSWQYQKIAEDLYSVAFSYYNSLHDEWADKKEAKKEYDDFITNLGNDNWKYFTELEIAQVKNNIEEIKKRQNTTNENEIKNNKIELFVAETKLSNLEYRLKENVSYESSYLNTAIKVIDENAYSVASYENATNDKDRSNYQESVKTFYENKYILETKEDTNNSHTNRAVLMEFFSEYNFLTLVFVIMIAGGIISDEFNKGTIKSMLITPYKRLTILTSKLITSLLMIIFFTVFALIVQFIVGSVVFGFEGLGVPVVIYNLSTKSIEVISLVKYLLIMFVATLPQVILLTTFAFTASTVINNTAFAIAITFCGIIGTEIINLAATRLTFLNYFVTTNWDFTYYLFGNKSPFGLTLTHSIIVCLVYFIIMIILSCLVFKKKDIKNI